MPEIKPWPFLILGHVFVSVHVWGRMWGQHMHTREHMNVCVYVEARAWHQTSFQSLCALQIQVLSLI